MTSPIIRAALDRLKELRDEHRLITQAAYEAAEEATNGALLNERGQARMIDPFSLFTHNHTYLLAYASPELVEWIKEHPRVTFADYEAALTDNEPF